MAFNLRPPQVFLSLSQLTPLDLSLPRILFLCRSVLSSLIVLVLISSWLARSFAAYVRPVVTVVGQYSLV